MTNYMKSKYAFMALAACTLLTTACSDDDWAVGNPQIEMRGELPATCFGDSLRFTVNASDAEVPLSTLKAALFFGEEMVNEAVVRTKVSGKDYEAKIYVPYLANIPDGRATLRVTLQNINFTTKMLEYEVPITHPDYDELTFTAEDGTEYKMERQEKYVYSFTERLPQELRGFITAPKFGENGNELKFGYENSAIKVNAEGSIPFTNSGAGRYTVSFNTYTFEGSPFVVLKLNGQSMTGISETLSQLDLALTQGQTVTPEGFPEYDSWWIDPDYFEKAEDGSLKFLPVSGNYRIIADTKLKYFRVYPVTGGQPSTLGTDGSGTVWAIGEGIGKPSLSNAVGWTTENALAMAPMGNKRYQLTLVSGVTLGAESINFKFFSAMGWDGAFVSSRLTSASDMVGVGDGNNGHDDGNLFLTDGSRFETNGIYVFTVDLSAGNDNAVLTVEYKGQKAFEEEIVRVNGEKMSTVDNSAYNGLVSLNQGDEITFSGVDISDGFYADPDYFDNNGSSLTFRPLSGSYMIRLNKATKLITAVRYNGDAEATLGADGHGAVWLMGWGVGLSSQDNQIAWNPGEAYCMAEIAPGVYQFTGQAGPEQGSLTGQRFRADYLSFKFFHQDGWGGEFSGDNALTMVGTASRFLKDTGNLELADGVTLEVGATYRITVDCSKGLSSSTIDMVKL